MNILKIGPRPIVGLSPIVPNRFSVWSYQSRFRQLTSWAGDWAWKESLASYVNERTPVLDRYFQHLPRTKEEDDLAARIEERYKTKAAYNYLHLLPYRLNFKNPGISQATSGPEVFRNSDVSFFQENGFLGPVHINSISQTKLANILARFTGMLEGSNPDQSRLKILRQEWRDADVLDLVTNPEIVAKLSSLLGKNIKMRFTSMHEVAPGIGSFSKMTQGRIADFYAHSDMNLGTAVIPRNDTDPPFCDRDAISVWVSISGTTKDNAPLFIFPKTHRFEITTPLTYLEHVKNTPKRLTEVCKLLSTKGFANQLNANHKLFYDYLSSSVYQSSMYMTRRIELYMKPGDCLFFTTHLLHGSGVNSLLTSRLGMSIRYSSALNAENEENRTVVRSLFNEEERARLGLSESDERIPIIQVLGTDHHPGTVPVNVAALKQILIERTKQ